MFYLRAVSSVPVLRNPFFQKYKRALGIDRIEV